MKYFGVVQPKEYTVQEFFASSPLGWTLQSGSSGTLITSPVDDEIEGAVTITRANGDSSLFSLTATPYTNPETGVQEQVLYSSVKHLFYDRGRFFDSYSEITSSLWDLTKNFYVVSIGQDFYGERVKPGTFELEVDSISSLVRDDAYGNLYISQSGTGSFIGNIFYDNGIAVVAENTSSVTSSISSDGIKIVSGSLIDLQYYSDVKVIQHEINVKIEPRDFNFAFLNPSLRREVTPTASVAQQYIDDNIPSGSTEGSWKVQTLMQAGVMKPYVTSIGLYNDEYELLAVAKLSTPIQRTFDADQIFIVRFDV